LGRVLDEPAGSLHYYQFACRAEPAPSEAVAVEIDHERVVGARSANGAS
jgi:hypothetical protein